MASQSPQYVTPVMSYDSSKTGTSEMNNLSKTHLKLYLQTVMHNKTCHNLRSALWTVSYISACTMFYKMKLKKFSYGDHYFHVFPVSCKTIKFIRSALFSDRVTVVASIFLVSAASIYGVASVRTSDYSQPFWLK